MKRWKIAGICLAVAVAAAASGCGKKTGTETTAAESTAAETEEYVAESSVKLEIGRASCWERVSSPV